MGESEQGMGSRMGMGIGGVSGGVGNKNLGCLSNRASCSSNSQCCSGNCKSFETKRYWTINACAPLKSSDTNGISNQEGAYVEQENRNLGCLGREYLCSASSQCCSWLKCRQITPM